MTLKMKVKKPWPHPTPIARCPSTQGNFARSVATPTAHFKVKNKAKIVHEKPVKEVVPIAEQKPFFLSSCPAECHFYVTLVMKIVSRPDTFHGRQQRGQPVG